jgi:hypothetical protein
MDGGVHVFLYFLLWQCCNMRYRWISFYDIHRWVKNYPHYRYMFCSWLYCCLGMTKYTWSTPFLPLWCRCDLDSPLLSWVFLP